MLPHRTRVCSVRSESFCVVVENAGNRRHTPRQPIVTGTSVLALKFKDGIMMAADTLGMWNYATYCTTITDSTYPIASYGSLARFKSIQRLHSVGKSTIIGASGDMSDFQYIQRLLEELAIEEFTAGDNHDLGPAEVHEYLSRVMYARRSKLNPLWNSLLVGGVREGKR